MTLRIVEEKELRELVHEEESLEAVELAFRALSEGRVEQPPPMGFDFPEADGETHVKGAFIQGAPIFAVKVASGFYGNPARELPVGSGLVLVFDAQTGFPLAVLMDNAYLTEMRTAAAGALAVRLLAHPEIEKLAVLGTGSQARYQLRAITRVCSVKSVSAWSPTRSHRERYCNEMQGELGIPFSSAERPEDALSGAALVVTVTNARAPIVPVEAVSERATIIAVGSDGPDKQELEASLVAGAGKVVVDRLSQCLRLGEVHHAVAAGLMSDSDVHAELGDVTTGKKPGREDDELIICDLTGVGAQDAAIAEIAWKSLTRR